MNKLLVRTLSGIIYAGLIIGAVCAGKIWFLALMILFAVLAVTEFERFSIQRPVALPRKYGVCSMCLPPYL